MLMKNMFLMFRELRTSTLKVTLLPVVVKVVYLLTHLIMKVSSLRVLVLAPRTALTEH